MDLNKVMLIGNVTQDPEVRTIPTGSQVTSFGLATNMVWNDQNGIRQTRAEFHNIVAWKKLAEICGQYLSKGKKVYIEGRLQTRSWDDQSGTKRYRTEVVAENMIMLDRGGSGNSNASGGFSAKNIVPNDSVPIEPPVSDVVENEIKVEDIPF